MLVDVFVSFSEILFRFLVEGFLAPKRAEVIGLAFVLGCASGGRAVNIHSANGIMYCSCHRFLLLLDLIIALIGRSTEGLITRYLIGIFAYAYFFIS